MKRTVSFCMAFLLLGSSLTTVLTGCGNSEDKKVAASGIYDERIDNGEWLQLVNQKFGFTTASPDKTYFPEISSENPFYQDVQISAYMGVLPSDYTGLDLSQELTREFCAVTLAGAVYIKNDENVYISDISDSRYQDSIKTVVNEGIMGLTQDGKFSPKDKIPYVEASVALEQAYNAWAYHNYEKTQYEYAVADDVIDLVGVSTVQETDDNTFEKDQSFVEKQEKLMEDNNFSYNPSSGKIYVNDAAAMGIKENSVMIVPDATSDTGSEAVKIVRIIEKPDGTYELDTETAELTDVFDKLNYHDTASPQLNNTTFYDENGNPIPLDNSGVADNGLLTDAPFGTTQLGMTDPGAVQLLDNDIDLANKKSFTVKLTVGQGSDKVDLAIKVTASSSEFGIKFSAGPKYEKKFNENPQDKDQADKLTLSTTGAIEFKVKNVKLNTALEVDKWCGIPKGIKYFKSSASFDTEASMSVNSKFNFRKHLFTAPYQPPVPGLMLKLSLYAETTLSGEIVITSTITGWEAGMEYRSGNLSYIMRHDAPKTDVTGKIDLQFSLPIKLSLVIINDDFASGYAEAKAGIGLNASEKMNTVEYPDKDPYQISCIDLKLYLIASVKAGILVDIKVKKWDVSKEWEILNKDNCTLKEWHFENLKLVAECSAKAAKEAKKDKDTEDSGVKVGERLRLDQTDLEVVVGDTAEIKLEEIPKGYDLKKDVLVRLSEPDIVKPTNASVVKMTEMEVVPKNLSIKTVLNDTYLQFSNDNPSLLSVSGLKPGAVTVVYMTKDMKYQAYCLVKVIESEADRERMLPMVDSGLELSEALVHLEEGESREMVVSRIPDGTKKEDLIWESEDPSVAVVDANGKVTGKGYGITRIVVRTKDGKFSYRCVINVFGGGNQSADAMVF